MKAERHKLIELNARHHAEARREQGFSAKVGSARTAPPASSCDAGSHAPLGPQMIDDAWTSRLVMYCVVDWIYVVRIHLFREPLYIVVFCGVEILQI
jgi:hypothetical protein